MREALNNANTDSDTTGGDCATGFGADTINLPAGTYTFAITGAGEDSNATGDLDLTDAAGVTIVGVGARSTIVDANDLDRVFDVRAGAAGFEQLTIQNGLLATGDVVGGGIRTEGSSLVITGAAIRSNYVTGWKEQGTLFICSRVRNTNKNLRRGASLLGDSGNQSADYSKWRQQCPYSFFAAR